MLKISERDKKILLITAGIILVALSYVFVYRPQVEKARKIQSENEGLQVRLQELLDMAKDKELYVQKTSEMQIKIGEYGSEFPEDVRSEDGVVLARNMENSVDIRISGVELGAKEFLYSLDEGAENQGQEEIETLSRQNNEATQEQINEIEGVEEEEERPEDADVQEYSAPTLYRNQDTLQFQCNYEQLKRAVSYLGTQTGRMTLNNVNVSFDSATGMLTGSMAVDLFSMTGMDTSYTIPDAGKVSYGIDNIFGTIEAPSEEESQGDGEIDQN